MLIHGSLCDSRYWKLQLNALSKKFCVYSLSLRHYWPEFWIGDGIFSIEQHAEDIFSFIKNIVKTSVHLLGHSRGGTVALEIAKKYPTSLTSLILCEPNILSKNQPNKNPHQQILDLISIGKVDDGLRQFVNAVNGPETWNFMASWIRNMLRENSNTLVPQFNEVIPKIKYSDISSINLPTLLIGGVLSPNSYKIMLKILQNWLPNSQIFFIPDSSHSMNLSNPRIFNSILERFLLKQTINL
ncbi:MAG: alpha/beta hydrolase [Bordetella sp.]|nr:MAG: alpha/beta hydrolase [Bordetella sp.]